MTLKPSSYHTVHVTLKPSSYHTVHVTLKPSSYHTFHVTLKPSSYHTFHVTLKPSSYHTAHVTFAVAKLHCPKRRSLCILRFSQWCSLDSVLLGHDTASLGDQFHMFLWNVRNWLPIDASQSGILEAVLIFLSEFCGCHSSAAEVSSLVSCDDVSLGEQLDCSSAFIFRVSKTKVLKTKALRTSKMSGATYPKTGVTYQKTWMSSSLLLLHTSVSSHSGAGVLLLCHHYDQVTS